MSTAAPARDETLTTASPAPHHLVQFYEDDGFLCEVVAEFIHQALAANQPVLVVATPEHRATLLERLAELGVEVSRARLGGMLTLADARETLARFMVGDGVDEAACRAVVGETLETCLRGREAARVHVFGEMVDLLWRDQLPEAAIRLESLWNELAREYPMQLLCGYSIANFDHASDAEAFLRVCEAHDHVAPTEAYLRLDEKERLCRITVLEQRAQALETEVRYRRRLERRLRRAAAEATAANQAKSEFLAVMSHELRTPLNAIGGYAELMEMEIRGPITDAQRQDLRRIQQSQRHLLGLVNEVLNYARLESGTVDYTLEDIPAAEALHSAAALVAPLARGQSLSFRVEPGAGALTVRADAEKLRQILVNLLSNAVKFTPAGGRVSLRCEQREGWVCFVVRDSGIGIPADRLEAIFEPFVQVRSDLTREHGGTGLGLAISRSLAEAMGGRLHVQSRSGRGSTFILRLPQARPEKLQVALTLAPAPAEPS